MPDRGIAASAWPLILRTRRSTILSPGESSPRHTSYRHGNYPRNSKYVEFMFNGAEYLPERVVLLGIRADRPETEYGWIEPARTGILPVDGSLRPVKRF